MDTGVVSEVEVWTRACANDGRAFTSLFDRHRDRVFRHVLRLVDNAHDAEEVTSASFFELWRRRASVILVSDSVLPWLLVTADNIARNVSRGTRRYRALFDSLPRADATADAEQIAVAHIEEGESVGYMKAAMKMLKPADASLVVLVVLEDYAVTEAATLLGLSDGAARTRLHRAKGKIREQLTEART
ncbi:RNA polymerase sigma factor [Cryobacterium lyxosi]|jgi:RNA polymerase sigma-70 factor (ECF subfamily)|uniref:RNA polymerase sigma factor n=1 Tax=Cryobacterium lyxosi TaxID=1259228 RepID=A0A4R8ZI06_9MICO|nr:RNA polymerase sigma factor [Cryobacterium lyxosi]TFD26188.1 RNA polymerase sigma factor [Cryobacterium lyxosi]